MISPERQELERLRIANRELAEELDEYRRWEQEIITAGEVSPASCDERRILLWRDAFQRVDRHQNHARIAARLLVLMLDAPGREWSKPDIHEALCSAADQDERGLSAVVVCSLRRYLRVLGLGEMIETMWGVGYCLPLDQRRRLLAFEEGLAEAAAAALRHTADAELMQLRELGRRYG